MTYGRKLKYNSDPLMDTLMNYKMDTSNPMTWLGIFVVLAILVVLIVVIVRAVNKTKNTSIIPMAGYGCAIPGGWNSSCNAPIECQVASSTQCGKLKANCADGQGNRYTTSAMYRYDPIGQARIENINGKLTTYDPNCPSKSTCCSCWNCINLGLGSKCDQDCKECDDLQANNCNCANPMRC
jgi:hypothetical protein